MNDRSRCDQFGEMISRSLDDDLSLDEIQELKVHLETCQLCQELAKHLRATMLPLNALASKPVSVSYIHEQVESLEREGYLDSPSAALPPVTALLTKQDSKLLNKIATPRTALSALSGLFTRFTSAAAAAMLLIGGSAWWFYRDRTERTLYMPTVAPSIVELRHPATDLGSGNDMNISSPGKTATPNLFEDLTNTTDPADEQGSDRLRPDSGVPRSAPKSTPPLRSIPNKGSRQQQQPTNAQRKNR